MTHEFKQTSVKCFEWSIQVDPSSSDTTLLSEKFAVRNRECRLEFHVKPFLLLKIARVCFKSDGKFDSPVAATVHVMSNSETSSLETHTIKDEEQEIWKHRGTSSLDPSLTFQIIIHADPSEKGEQEETLTIQRPLKEASEGSLEPKNNFHLEALSKDFTKLLDESSTCDVEITCDGKSFKAHRIILGTRSRVFSAMLKSNMVESNTGVIKLEDVKASIFQCFLRYLYSGTLPEMNDFESAMEFYEVGDKYAVEELKRASSEFLIENLTEACACEVLVLADRHSDDDFRKRVMSYVVDENIPQRDRHWPNFCKSHCNLANDVMFLCIQKYCPK